MMTLSQQTVVAYNQRMERAGVPRREAGIASFLAKLAFKRQSEATLERAARAAQLLLQLRRPLAEGDSIRRLEGI